MFNIFVMSKTEQSVLNRKFYKIDFFQIDRKRNARFIKTGELADHLLERLRRFEELEEEKLREKQYKESLVSVKLINYNCFICSSLFNCSIMIQIRRSDNYKCCKYYKNCEFISVLRCTDVFQFQVNIMFNGAHTIPDVANLTEAMKFPYTTKLSEIYDAILKAFCAKTSVSVSDVRLLLCKDFTYSIIRSFTENEMQKVIITKC